MNRGIFCYRKYKGTERYLFIGKFIFWLDQLLGMIAGFIFRYFYPVAEPVYKFMQFNNFERGLADIIYPPILFVVVQFFMRKWLSYHESCDDRCCCNQWFCYRTHEGFEKYNYIAWVLFMIYCFVQISIISVVHSLILNRYIIIEILFRMAMCLSGYYLLYQKIFKSWLGSHYGCDFRRCQYEQISNYRDEDTTE